LEIALVLAREMKAAAARSVDASLRLDQLQEVFGAPQLDRAERTRIQTALQMAGLEPQPSLIDADPAAPIRFGVASVGTGATVAPARERGAGSGDGETATFPTVGEFARSKLRGRRRGGDGGGEEQEPPRLNGAATAVEGDGHEPQEEPEEELAPGVEDPLDFDEPLPAEAEQELEHEVEREPEPESEPEEQQEPEPESEHGDEPELAPEEDLDFGDEVHVHHEPEPPAAPAVAEPEQRAEGARLEEVAAVLLPAVAIPVLVTSIAGWRFGLPFLALALIATGWAVGRRARDADKPRGMIATIRSSPAAGTVILGTLLVTVLSGGAAALLASVGGGTSSNSGGEAAQPSDKQPAAKSPAADEPAKSKDPGTKAAERKAAERKAKAEDKPDPDTEGLIRVTPKPAENGTSGDGTGTPPAGAGTQPGATTPPSGAQTPLPGTQTAPSTPGTQSPQQP
jgi:hypothetical protein